MSQLPDELAWGVDVAIKKLRPGAAFQLHGINFIYWNDPNGLDAPTWEDIETVMKEDEKRAAEWIEANTYTGQKPVPVGNILYTSNT